MIRVLQVFILFYAGVLLDPSALDSRETRLNLAGYLPREKVSLAQEITAHTLKRTLTVNALCQTYDGRRAKREF